MMRFPLIFLAALAIASCANAKVKDTDSAPNVEVSTEAARAKALQYAVKVVREYPHDPTSYTQGLFFHEGKLYESGGGYGESMFREVDLTTGQTLRRFDLKDRYFAEGAVIFKGMLYMLTWENGMVFLYDPDTFQYKKTCYFPHEGWGLTTDGKQLIASDGSARIYFMDAECKIKGSIDVKLNGRALDNLNELEYIDGRIWANVYTSDMIAVINPQTGVVEATVDCSGLLPDALRGPETDVLNGIAQNPEDGKIFLTGKRWKRLYEIELVEK